jgi:hypothetical protein
MTQKHTLKTSVSLDATTIELNSFNLPDGTAIVSGDLGSINYATIAPGTANEESISFTGLSGTSLTGVTRGLRFDSPYTQDTGLRKAHSAGAVLVLSNTAAFYDNFVNKNNDETMTQHLTGIAPTADLHFATKKYVDDTTNGGAVSHDQVIIAGTAGATVAAGEIVYFDATAKEWLLADASTAATSEQVILGIAQGAGTDGAAISGGVLLSGLDTNQTGMTAGTKQFLSDTAGALSESAGTVEVTIGFSNSGSTTDLIFDPMYDQKITEDIQDALAGGGDFGTVSATNKYLTETFLTNRQKFEVFTSNDTWTKPTNAKIVEVWCIGGGGGGGNGGNGSEDASGAGGGGGGGGGAGGVSTFTFNASILGATETITIGAAGIASGNGGTTSFGSWLQANFGAAGADGSNASGSSAGAAGGAGTAGVGNYATGTLGGAGGAGNTIQAAGAVGSVGVASVDFVPTGGGGGGGGGGESSGSGLHGDGGNGGEQTLVALAGGVGATASGVSGSAGQSVTANSNQGGTGGGGGAGGDGTTGGTADSGGVGGSAGSYGSGGGGGGGGGGADTSGTAGTGGAGGVGGIGICVVISYL